MKLKHLYAHFCTIYLALPVVVFSFNNLACCLYISLYCTFCQMCPNPISQTPPLSLLLNFPVTNFLLATDNSFLHHHLDLIPQSYTSTLHLPLALHVHCIILTLVDRYRCNYWCRQHTCHHSYSYSQCSLHHWSDSWYQRNQVGMCKCKSSHTGYMWRHCGTDRKHIHPHLSHNACHQIHPHKGTCSHQSHQDMFHHSDMELKSRLHYFICDEASSCSLTL